MAPGVPIEGAAGVGYRTKAGFDLPPLMFTKDEAQALVASVWLDPALARHAEGALSKILAVLPPAARAAAESLAIYAPPFGPDVSTRRRLEALRIAGEAKHMLRIVYLDLKAQRSERVVRPLGCFYWGADWTLGAWCEARDGFCNFRVDRITELQVLDARFRDEPDRTPERLGASASCLSP